MSLTTPVQTVQTVSDGQELGETLNEIRNWFGKYVCVVEGDDLALLTLWAAHTHVAEETYTTPRLLIDSLMHGSGKTTVIEHLNKFSFNAVQMASISSPALLGRMVHKGACTILIDEVDRSLDPKMKDVEQLIAILNSGYKFGATRPVLVQGRGGDWDMVKMSTFAPVAMAGNSPHLPDDTRSRSIRVLLMPDIRGEAAESDWELIEANATELASRLGDALNANRQAIKTVRPELPEGCIGRMREKWSPLARVAEIAGGQWSETITRLIERDMNEVEMERQEGLANVPAGMVLLNDLRSIWPETEPFKPTSQIIRELMALNPDYWSERSPYGRALTAQRLSRLLIQSTKQHSIKNNQDVRGYARLGFERAWRQLGLDHAIESSESSESSKPSRGNS